MSASHMDHPQRSPNPRISIVIPVYNEEAILEAAVKDLLDRLTTHFEFPFELILAENGSRDQTVALAQQLAERFPEVRTFSLGEPNYGKALKRGILEARGEIVICDEIDLCDTDFYSRALALLDSYEADLVVGSKVLDSSSDERPFLRHFATIVINGMLRVSLGFKGTDTHGLKAFRRAAVVPVVERCIVDKDLFASELVIRAERSQTVQIKEIPVRVLEKRPPSIHLFRRVPNVLKGIARLVVAIRIKG
ncbi:MAG TPA: glycosyltransferase [Polyangiales bacterium]|nr:glycosyltransferase [Polyangiales bacterium]